jgi:hypothetical protein
MEIIFSSDHTSSSLEEVHVEREIEYNESMTLVEYRWKLSLPSIAIFFFEGARVESGIVC